MRKYICPPLVEAICDFHFLPSQPWDSTVLGLVYDRIKEQFPDKIPLPAIMLNITFGAAPGGMPPGGERMRFRKADGSALVQVGPNNLTVNHLTPYTGWPQFQAMIDHLLKVYREVADPQGLQRVVLRYVNRMDIPATALNPEGYVAIEDYLLAQPSVPQAVPQVFTNWAQRVEIPFKTASTVLALQSGTVIGSEKFPVAFLLDLEMSPVPDKTVILDKAQEWLEQAHINIEDVFEQCLGPKARDLFGVLE
jgi:uncharacterized protein (TIGR04255 family)